MTLPRLESGNAGQLDSATPTKKEAPTVPDQSSSPAPTRATPPTAHADRIRQLDAKCKAQDLSDNDRHEVLKFAEMLDAQGRGWDMLRGVDDEGNAKP